MIDEIIAYESGQLDDAGTLRLFSELIKSGQAYQLQGHYGRTASALINDGWINRDGSFTDKPYDNDIL